jgi:hypothetical protein
MQHKVSRVKVERSGVRRIIDFFFRNFWRKFGAILVLDSYYVLQQGSSRYSSRLTQPIIYPSRPLLCIMSSDR